MSFLNYRSVVAVCMALAAPLIPATAMSATVDISDGEVINPIALDTTYVFEEQMDGDTGAIERMFTFVADESDAPLPVIASNLTLTGVNGTVVSPFMTWFDGTNTITAVFEDIVLQNTTIGVGTVLQTLFDAPDRLTQKLTVGWSSFDGDSIQVSLQVAAVPLPAGGLLLLTALGGVVALRRKRKAA